MRFSPRTLAVVAAGMLLVPAAITAGPASAHRGHSSHDDGGGRSARIAAADFLPKAAQSNRFEIATGQLAQTNGGSDAVRALGAMLVQDHTALLEQGSALAAELGVAVPDGLSPFQQRVVDRLGDLNGDAFDRAWIATQEVVHKQALSLTLWAAVRGVEPRLRTLAQDALPTITRHLAELAELTESHGDDDGDHGDDGGRWGHRHDHGDDHGRRGHDHGSWDRGHRERGTHRHRSHR
jgi:putative membrane protein